MARGWSQRAVDGARRDLARGSNFENDATTRCGSNATVLFSSSPRSHSCPAPSKLLLNASRQHMENAHLEPLLIVSFSRSQAKKEPDAGPGSMVRPDATVLTTFE